MRPPWRGAGLLQLRWRTWNPIPQEVLHRAQDDHGVHAPFLVGPEGTETMTLCPEVGDWSLLQSGGGIWALTPAWFLGQEGGGVLGQGQIDVI